MTGLDPIPHLKVAQTPPNSTLGCPVCRNHFAAKDGYVFLTHWHAENEHGERERKAGYLCFDKLTCILCFVNDGRIRALLKRAALVMVWHFFWLAGYKIFD